MHSRKLYCTVKSFTAQQTVLLNDRKFCHTAENSILWQKLKKNSFYSRNINSAIKTGNGKNKKVNSAAETGEKFFLQQK